MKFGAKEPIKEITIVGGGTSGWLVAAFLNHRLQWGLTGRPDVRVTVIEAPDIPTIGVGEATVPTLKATLRILEISESEFIQRTDATFKLGIHFENWERRDDGSCSSYCHPFSGGESVRGRNPGFSFARYGLPDGLVAEGPDFIDAVSHARLALKRGKGPRRLGAAEFTGALNYAYHINAKLFADFLKEICVSRGVTYLRDKVVGAQRDARGHIASLQLAEHGNWPVELVIDCTGFKGLLINGVMEEPFTSFSEYLLNDRAIPIQVDRHDPDTIFPATVARAMQSGWSWRLPLFTRNGMGYVYSSAFISDEAALTELQSLLGDQPPLIEPHVIPMRVGYTRRPWVGNCVAIGPSSGFLEPLESTAIMLIELGVRFFLENFPSTDFEEPLQWQFNQQMLTLYEEVRDFLGLHFSLSKRTDTPYWLAVRNDVKLSDTLRNNLAVWKYTLPGIRDARTDAIFGHWSVQALLFGKGYYDEPMLRDVDVVPYEVWRWYWADYRARKRATIDALADHATLLRSIRAIECAGDTLGQTPKGRDFTVDEDAFLEATKVMRDADRGRRNRKAEKMRRVG